MSTVKSSPIRGVSPFAFFRSFPVAGKVFTAFWVAIVLLSGLLFTASAKNPSVFFDWIATLQPVVDWTSRFFPAIDTLNAERGKLEIQTVAAVPNAVALNFLVVCIFAPPIIGSSILDFRNDRRAICNKIDGLIAKSGMSRGSFIAILLVGCRVSTFVFSATDSGHGAITCK